MTTNISQAPLKNPSILIMALSMLIILACGDNKKPANDGSPEAETDPSIQIVTELMDFQLKDTIKSGWQTFRYTNTSKEPHFFLLEKYPEGKSLADCKQEVIPPFQKGMNLINEGRMDEAMEAFGELPEWFPQIVFMGGSGLISPGGTAVTTLKMEPGYYVIECYVKMENGVFHSAMGMLEDLVVLPDSVNFKPPSPTVSLSISREGGIMVQDTIGPGTQVFKVDFTDQGPHEHFLGHDVNLVKLAANANPDSLGHWMNWSDPKGLISPSPQGVTFLGGVNEMPAGYVGYFTAELTPGKYALISEVPSPKEKNMLHTFEVASQGQP